jgi:hypothetical protein
MDRKNKPKTDLDDKAVEIDDQTQGIDFVTLGMFIIGKTLHRSALAIHDCPSSVFTLPCPSITLESTRWSEDSCAGDPAQRMGGGKETAHNLKREHRYTRARADRACN